MYVYVIKKPRFQKAGVSYINHNDEEFPVLKNYFPAYSRMINRGIYYKILILVSL